MCTYFRTESQDVARNLTDNFVSTLTVRKKSEFFFFEKTEAMDPELNDRAKAATSSYSAAIDF